MLTAKAILNAYFDAWGLLFSIGISGGQSNLKRAKITPIIKKSLISRMAGMKYAFDWRVKKSYQLRKNSDNDFCVKEDKYIPL